jgi:hypothetical protein
MIPFNGWMDRSFILQQQQRTTTAAQLSPPLLVFLFGTRSSRRATAAVTQ